MVGTKRQKKKNRKSITNLEFVIINLWNTMKDCVCMSWPINFLTRRVLCLSAFIVFIKGNSILKGTVQRGLEENNRNSTTCSKF